MPFAPCPLKAVRAQGCWHDRATTVQRASDHLPQSGGPLRGKAFHANGLVDEAGGQARGSAAETRQESRTRLFCRPLEALLLCLILWEICLQIA